MKWVIHVMNGSVSGQKKCGISFCKILLKDYIVFLGAFSIINLINHYFWTF